MLTTFPHDPVLDLDPWVGQRSCTFRFALTNGVTGENKGDIFPLRGASLTHDTSRTIKRQLALSLGVEDTARVDPVTDRVDVFMVLADGREFPLGRYMFTDRSNQVFTSGRLASMALNDEMFRVDQQITTGITGIGRTVQEVILRALDQVDGVVLDIEGSSYLSRSSWTVGAARGQILESLSVDGDYFSPWFGNDTKMHWVRSFNPSTRVPDFDWDNGNQVFRAGIVETDDLLTAPNRFIVISNSATNTTQSVVGTADVPATAPHSEANRGFVIAQTEDLQVADAGQATAVANNLANRQTIFERVNVTTAPDPRHDSYNVIRWQGELWLELAWSMALVEGGGMGHALRKGYKP